MANLTDSLLIQVALILIISAAYIWWLWSRLRVGRYDALFVSIAILCIQLMAAFNTPNPSLALLAVGYHAALVSGVFTASRSLIKVKS